MGAKLLMTTSMYGVFNLGDTGRQWRVVKIAEGGGAEYMVTLTMADEWWCTCPVRAGRGRTCRHVLTVQEARKKRRIGKGWLYDYDHRVWFPPVATGDE